MNLSIDISPETMERYRTELESAMVGVFRVPASFWQEDTPIRMARTPFDPPEPRRYQAYNVQISYQVIDNRPLGDDGSFGSAALATAWALLESAPRFSLAGMPFDEGVPGQPLTVGCPCALCRARRVDYQGAGGAPQIGPIDDQTAYTSLQELLAGCTPYEAIQARDALRRGDMYGKSTTHCLIGHLAKARGSNYYQFNSRLSISQIESWVIDHIDLGMTPANNAHAALLDSWLSEWIDARTLEVRTLPLPSTLLAELETPERSPALLALRE